MPKWIHQRAEHLLAKNPKMRKSTAFAVATQQSKKKEAAILPEFLDKPRRGERLEPGSEDFAKNQAFGHSLGSGGLPGGMLGALAGGAGLGRLAGRTGNPLASFVGGVGGGVLGMGAGMGLGTAAMYPSKLREYRARAEKLRDKEEDKLQGAKEKMKKAYVAQCKKVAAIRTPESQLAKTQNIGVPKLKPPGKGIGQIAKPKGFGTVLPGLGNNS